MDDAIKDMSILIVDDEPAIARLFTTVLQRAGFTKVKSVNCGMDALDVLGNLHSSVIMNRDASQRFPVDLLLSDIMLPDIAGYEVCKRFKKAARGSYLPVILLTGLTIEDTNARYIESGADDFLTKPTKPAELVARVSLLLKRKAAQLVEAAQGHATDDGKADSSMPFRASSDMPEVGQLVGGWRIDRSIAWSGASVVFDVTGPQGRRGAMKMLTSQARLYADVVARFEREGELMASFHHPNVIEVWENSRHGSSPFYVMEYIDGPNVEKLMQAHTRGSFEMIYRIALGTAAGLAYVHDQGVIHRDVKLNNIHVTDHGRGAVKLADFGIALSTGETRITQHGYAIGTPIYMAPEQFDGRSVSPRSDIYSYGVAIYQLITGELPFSAANAMELMRKHLTSPPDPMSIHRANVPREWEELIVGCCLAKAPKDRPASMHEVQDALESLATLKF